MNQHNLNHTHKELRALLGTRFSTDDTVRDAHARDASYHRGALPDAVAFPKTNTEVADIVKICAKHKIPIIPYGTGTGVEGAVVTADGSIVHTGSRARKSAAGYDLTRLFIGSEGTLGIITEITLKLTRLPEAVAAAVCAFPSVAAAVDTVIKMMDTSISIARIELLDELQMEAVNKYAGLDYQVAPTLFLEFHGSEHTVAESSEIAGKIAARHGSGDFRWTTDETKRKRLWQARYDSYYAALNRRPGSVGYVTDVCVPISRLAECIAKTKARLATSDLTPSILGHVGDGNFHVVFPLEPHNKDELAEAQRLSREIVDIALEMDGTCTGEHGVGIGKRNALEKEHGEAVNLMRAIKHALDPQNLMNPGKVFL